MSDYAGVVSLPNFADPGSYALSTGCVNIMEANRGRERQVKEATAIKTDK